MRPLDVLFVAAHRLGRAPSQRFRFEQYLDYLEANDIRCTLAPLLPTPADDALFYRRGAYARKFLLLARALGRRFVTLLQARRFDVVFIHRSAFPVGPPFFERMCGRPLIYDFDDALWLPAASAGNRRLARLKNNAAFGKCLAHADLVLAGNSYLAGYARSFNPNVEIAPTTVDTDLYRPNRTPDPHAPVTIGWSGSPTTVSYFEPLVPVLARLKAQFGDRLRVRLIGDPTYRRPELDLIGEKWSVAAELQALDDFDIGVMPLPDDPWARGKCGLKGLTYMAFGRAAVLSPVGVNKTMIKPGENGLLAQTPEEWEAALTLLIEDFDLRQRLGQAGRRAVEEHWSVNAWRDKYVGWLRGVS